MAAVAAAQVEANDEEDILIFEDYSKIIEELRSHRREIEKLQSDFTPSAAAASSGPARSPPGGLSCSEKAC